MFATSVATLAPAAVWKLPETDIGLAWIKIKAKSRDLEIHIYPTIIRNMVDRH